MIYYQILALILSLEQSLTTKFVGENSDNAHEELTY